MSVKITKGASKLKPATVKSDNDSGFAVIPRVIKGDTYMVMSSTQLEVEDEFADLYWSTQNAQNVFVTPPFEPRGLLRLVQHNNILSQCIDAMEVNIDGTGFDMVLADGAKTMDKGEAEKMSGFFNEPYPGRSMITIRRSLRRDLESIGWGFLEVLRTADNTIAVVRNIPAWTVRYVRLDDAVPVKKTVMRNGTEITFTLMERERRFGQKIGINVVYFREFGTSRRLSKSTGKWEDPAHPLPANDLASELLPFQVNPDDYSPYGLPRWINQLPSVIGSRKAEESNLEFFDSGGIPPAIIFVQGGTLTPNVSAQLRTYLSGQTKSRNRAVVVEAQASGGSIEGPAGNVQVRVERFGAERANDALFMKYDQATEDHVRIGFRLPPLFLGKAADYNFATAQVAYMVAEAQVFKPERMEFDEVMNKTLMAEMGAKTTSLMSLPITLTNVQAQLEGATLIQQQVNGQSLVDGVNAIIDTKFKYEKPAAPPPPPQPQGVHILPLGDPPKPGTAPVAGVNKDPVADPKTNGNNAKVDDKKTPAKPKAKPSNTKKVIKMAQDYAMVQGFVEMKPGQVLEDVEVLKAQIEALDEVDKEAVYSLLSHYQFGDSTKTLTDIVAGTFHDGN